jgi:hypothetical protein
MKMIGKLICIVWLVFLSGFLAFGSQSGSPVFVSSTFSCSRHCLFAESGYEANAQVNIAYDGVSSPVSNYDSFAMLTIDDGEIGTVGASSLFGKSTEFLAAEGIANPVPSTLARVIPGEGPFTTLGAPGSADVFVTDASAIQGMTPAQISQRLGIPASDTFTTIQFPTPAQGLASPVFRSNPGFIGGGVTSGGAPEFVIPNGPIPAGATTTILGPH